MAGLEPQALLKFKLMHYRRVATADNVLQRFMASSGRIARDVESSGVIHNPLNRHHG